MLDKKAFANAAALVTAVIYIACVGAAIIAPDLLFNFFALTFHGVNVEVLRSSEVSFYTGNEILGAVLWVGFVWLVFYGFASIYNNLRKGK